MVDDGIIKRKFEYSDIVRKNKKKKMSGKSDEIILLRKGVR
jgi:hypothetical protein